MRAATVLGAALAGSVVLSVGWLILVPSPGVLAQHPFDCGEAAVAAGQQKFLDCNPDPNLRLPTGYTGRTFKLLQDYPTAIAAEPRPWDAADLFGRRDPTMATDPGRRWAAADQYLRAVLGYVLEGSITAGTGGADFDPAQNSVRPWYQAPWLHYECTGREAIRGLTRERRSAPGELQPGLDLTIENWGASYFNPIGGHTVGQVWGTAGDPDLQKASFEVGAVAIKLLFTTATPDQIPHLARSPEWQAHVFPNLYNNPTDPRLGANPCDHEGNPTLGREIRPVRLLQVDIAVRDETPNPTGWVFGTFVYDASRSGESGWDRIDARLVPIGVMWGTDPTVKSHRTEDGPVRNPDLLETVINPGIPTKDEPHRGDQAVLMNLGVGGRLNGPVDNPLSACISCHGRSGFLPEPQYPRGVRNRGQYPDDCVAQPFRCFDRFFAQIPQGVHTPNEVLAPDLPVGCATRLDYSLLLAKGVRNYYDAQGRVPDPRCVPPPPPGDVRTRIKLPDITRDGVPGPDLDADLEPGSAGPFTSGSPGSADLLKWLGEGGAAGLSMLLAGLGGFLAGLGVLLGGLGGFLVGLSVFLAGRVARRRYRPARGQIGQGASRPGHRPGSPGESASPRTE